MKYEIHIGRVYDPMDNSFKSEQVIIVNEDQLSILTHFANSRKDKHLNTVYKINECEFQVLPHLANHIKYGE